MTRNSGGVKPCRSARLHVEALEDRCLLSVDMFVRDGTLFVIGDEAANDVRLVGTERGVQATGDDRTELFEGVSAIKAELGDGDDTATIDDSNGVLGGIAFQVLGQRGADVAAFVFEGLQLWNGRGARSLPSSAIDFDGGEGQDAIFVVGSDFLDEQFSVFPGASTDVDEIRIEIDDVTSGGEFTQTIHAKAELVTIKGGAGNDEFTVHGPISAALHLFGQGGDDSFSWSGLTSGPVEPAKGAFDGGEGNDKFILTATDVAELIEILGVEPVEPVPDPLIRVTDKDTGKVTFEAMVVGVEDVTVEARRGNDEMVLDDSRGPLGGINFHLFGQEGDDQATLLCRWKFENGLIAAWEGPELEGGEGVDKVLITTIGAQADGFEIRPGAEDNSIQIRATDLATGLPVASLRVVDTEDIAIKAGEGDDQFDVTHPFAAALHLFGQGGDDSASYDYEYEPGEPIEPVKEPFDGGEGNDKFILTATDVAELIEILGVEPVEPVPDPLIRVTDLATGIVTAELIVMGTEMIAVDSAGGNDKVMMSDADGPLTDIAFSIMTGAGDDAAEIKVDGSADSFFDVFVDLGEDNNAFDGMFTNPRGSLTVLGGGGIDVIRSKGEWTGSSVGSHPDFAWTPTYNPGDGPDYVALNFIGPALGQAGGIVPCIRANINTDGGNDTVLIDIAGSFDEFLIGLLTGAGDDGIRFDVANLKGPLSESFFGVESDFTGGPGVDVLKIVAGARGEQFDIGPGTERNSVQIDVSDIDTRRPLAKFLSVDMESITTAAGDGNDHFHVGGPVPAALILLGQLGDDKFELPSKSFAPSLAEQGFEVWGGAGQDSLQIVGTDTAERIEVLGVPDREVPDPEIRITDLATGIVTGDFFTQEVEQLSLHTRGGDDQVVVDWDDALMGALAEIDTDLGEGNNKILVESLDIGQWPGGTIPPRVHVSAGGGNDSVEFRFGAVVTSPLEIDVRLGGGNDSFLLNAIGWAVPTGVPGASVRVFGGAGRDVIVANFGQVSGELTAVLNGQTGNDLIAVNLVVADSSWGSIDINVIGGLGNDRLTLVALGLGDPLRQRLRIDGGPGFDIALATTNVLVNNCEVVIRPR